MTKEIDLRSGAEGGRHPEEKKSSSSLATSARPFLDKSLCNQKKPEGIWLNEKRLCHGRAGRGSTLITRASEGARSIMCDM
jgi:hypothetical protein